MPDTGPSVEGKADRGIAAGRLVLTALAGLPTVVPGMALAPLMLDAMRSTGIVPEHGDALVIAQKIVSKSEGRVVRLADIWPTARARELGTECDKDPRLVELILRESREVLRCRPGVLIVVHRLGFVLANAGIDASNVEAADGTVGADETVLLLPENPDASAARLRGDLRRLAGADLAVVVNDSFGRAWRMGTVGTAIGVSGLPGLLDLRGRPDRNGRLLRSTEVGVADELAAAASLLMGQAAEGRPIVHVRGFPYGDHDGTASELVRPAQLDLFR